jgi:hypothetical protein
VKTPWAPFEVATVNWLGRLTPTCACVVSVTLPVPSPGAALGAPNESSVGRVPPDGRSKPLALTFSDQGTFSPDALSRLTSFDRESGAGAIDTTWPFCTRFGMTALVAPAKEPAAIVMPPPVTTVAASCATLQLVGGFVVSAAHADAASIPLAAKMLARETATNPRGTLTNPRLLTDDIPA